ncbi:MAG: hypothetical protein K0S78_2507, partial [Thermomicrobiales bacterium]|nr:hypothetical protein [Thermomicrobiales bacterium]
LPPHSRTAMQRGTGWRHTDGRSGGRRRPGCALNCWHNGSWQIQSARTAFLQPSGRSRRRGRSGHGYCCTWAERNRAVDAWEPCETAATGPRPNAPHPRSFFPRAVEKGVHARHGVPCSEPLSHRHGPGTLWVAVGVMAKCRGCDVRPLRAAQTSASAQAKARKLSSRATAKSSSASMTRRRT